MTIKQFLESDRFEFTCCFVSKLPLTENWNVKIDIYKKSKFSSNEAMVSAEKTFRCNAVASLHQTIWTSDPGLSKAFRFPFSSQNPVIISLKVLESTNK